MRRYPLHKNDIKVKVEPKPTTSVIPFAKEAVVGRTIHMCFQEPDSMHLYKGKVTYYDEGAGTFHIDFFDEDTADIDFVSGGDTILWETMDVTRDAQWPEESSDLDIVPVEEEVEGTRMEVLPPVVGGGGKVPEHVPETKVEDAKEEVTVQPPEQEQQKEDVEKEDVGKEEVEKEEVEKEDVEKEEVEKKDVEKKEVEKVELGMDGLEEAKVEHEKKEDVVLQPVEERHKEEEIEVKQKEEEEHVLSPAPSIMDGVVLGKKSPAKPMVSEKQAPMQEKSQKDGVDQGAFKTFVGVKRKEGAIMKEDAVKHAKVEKEDGVAKVPTSSVQDGLATQRHEKDAPATELKKFINNYGMSFLNSLGELKQSIENLNTLSNMIKSYAEKEEATSIKKTDVPKTARGFLNIAFYGGKKYSVGIEHVWPLNDKLMKAVSELYDVTTSLCQTANFPSPKEPDCMKEWKKNQSRAGLGATKVQTLDAEHASKQAKKELTKAPAKSSASMKSDHDVEAVTYSKKNEQSLFQSTGNLFRDNAIRIFSQSLMSPATPFDIAADMEQAIFSKCNIQDKDQRLPDDYYTVVKSLWEVLNPASANCNPLLRIMLLHGYMTHNELLSLREGDLAHVERKFMEEIADNSWLRDSFTRQ
mmetsp:Transcript_9270/g.18408  ORF Transcript_9270/g.18408 Transcript_9270/m.18408 type:complete len:640 (-) Transcript_9270:127-2046(-)